jgi:acylphosphatase
MGYVRNVRDGSVELVVSGSPKTIAAFLAEIAETFAENISDSTTEEITLPEPLTGFVIRP